MTLFERNCAVVTAGNPELVARMKSGEGSVLEILDARSGVASAKRGGRWLHSAYDPVREAETWAQAQAASCKERELIVVAGVGLLYHVEALRRVLPPDQRIAVAVPSVAELRDALTVRPWDRGERHSCGVRAHRKPRSRSCCRKIGQSGC
ncbi:MAG: hypothetical protein U0231_15675 [Nitrospiraceae bacterium]